MQASLFTVGTEVTSGQILNENAKVLAQSLRKLGLTCSVHLSVPDDRKLILDGIRFCAEKSDLIFITGGLGPTSDDFTRDLIMEWAGRKPEFHEPSWQKVQARLMERGLVVHDFQKQQCYYPEGSQVLDNSQGTANGFYLQAHKKHLWALPGPPNEIQAIWLAHVQNQLKAFPIDPQLTRSWHVMELGENQLAHLVEPLVQNFNGEVGYRVHQPYVEFKLMYRQSHEAALQKVFANVETVLKPYTLARNEESVSQKFAEILVTYQQPFLFDAVTEGRWLQRLAPHMKSILFKANFTYSKKDLNLNSDLKVSLLENSADSVLLKIQTSEKQQEFVLKTPLKGVSVVDRRKLYYAELAMAHCVKFFETISN